jgi:Terminase large subunit, T4likevirus-type, N-terminal
VNTDEEHDSNTPSDTTRWTPSAKSGPNNGRLSKRPKQLHWQPQPGPQEMLLACPLEDIGFGGARGGGKTAGMLGDFLSHESQYGKHTHGLFLRRSYPELEEVIRQADALFLGWKKIVDAPTYRAPSGATLSFRALQRDHDADKFQGHAYTWIGLDEATQWPSPEFLDKLRACLRSSEARIRKRMIWTANPGGVGHNWYKARYVDPAPALTPFYDEALRTWRVFIPSRLDDNPKLTESDPDYWMRVEAAANGRRDLIKAWRHGEWDIVAGGMFDDLWRPDRHVLPTFPIPSSWRVDRAFDWGSSKPFSVGWWAESDGTQAPNGQVYPRGALFRIAEFYGWNGQPNQGLKMLAGDIAKKIVEQEKQMRDCGLVSTPIKPGPADTSIFNADNGVCIADDMGKHGITWLPADKSAGSRKTGAEKLRAHLTASCQCPMEDPGIFIFESCRQWIRCVPILPRDPQDSDDIDSNAEDHNYDETRYRLLQKPLPIWRAV